MSKIISVDEYMARWAYGELSSDRFADSYPAGEQTTRVREKAAANTPFDDLTAEDRKLLIRMLKNSGRARPYGGLLSGLDGITAFKLEKWSKAQMRATRVVPGLGSLNTGDFYNTMTCLDPASVQDSDPRKKVAGLPADATYKRSEPICVVPFGQQSLLLEGTGRTLAFLKLAMDDATIDVWVPA